ncbi:MAG: hypothetical protein Q8Q58_14960 [Candidatus Rokubacteria bacterium]|nr:hypothetical protein [Candidatus Rokubacteria bacterium]
MQGFEDVNHYFRKAARIMDLSSRVERLLVTPYREVKADPHKRDGMGLLNWTGFAVVI